MRKQKQDIQKNTNLETAEKALGVTGQRIKEKLENDKSTKGDEFRALNKKQQLAFNDLCAIDSFLAHGIID